MPMFNIVTTLWPCREVQLSAGELSLFILQEHHTTWTMRWLLLLPKITAKGSWRPAVVSFNVVTVVSGQNTIWILTWQFVVSPTLVSLCLFSTFVPDLIWPFPAMVPGSSGLFFVFDTVPVPLSLSQLIHHTAPEVLGVTSISVSSSRTPAPSLSTHSAGAPNTSHTNKTKTRLYQKLTKNYIRGTVWRIIMLEVNITTTDNQLKELTKLTSAKVSRTQHTTHTQLDAIRNWQKHTRGLKPDPQRRWQKLWECP